MSSQSRWFDIDRRAPLCLMKDLLQSRADRQDGVILDEALFNKVSPTGVEITETERE